MTVTKSSQRNTIGAHTHPPVQRQRITSRELAEITGLSQTTVSRALRGDARVAEETSVLVLGAARRLGYVPNAAARALNTGRTGTIGVVVADFTNPFYPELVEFLHDELTRSGYRMVLLNERTEVRGDAGLRPLLQGHAVDGMLFASATLGVRTGELLSSANVPMVLLNRDIEAKHVDAVVADNEGGAELAADLLCELGHTAIAAVMGPQNASTAKTRLAGFRKGLRQHGLELRPALVRTDEFSHQTGYQNALALLESDEPPTAIFCGNDAIAFGVLDAARRLGVDVPEQLSVIGFDDVAMAGWEAFRLTTVRQPLAQMGKEAVRILVDRLEGVAPDKATRRVFPTHLVQRATTAPPRRGKLSLG
jgi:LacI family transcriptional regulator